MILGAFIHMGLPAVWLEERLKRLSIPFSFGVSETKKMGINGNSVCILSDHRYQPDWRYKDIHELIYKSDLSVTVKKRSLSIIKILIDAESDVRNCNPDKVSFHEICAIDSIFYIVGAALCLDYFDINSLYSSPLPMGRGVVISADGISPLPTPTTLRILEKRKDVIVIGADVDAELVTPTGAAIISALTEEFGVMPGMRITNTGYGAGSKKLTNRPDMLRIIAGKPHESFLQSEHLEEDNVMLIECAVDDMNGEWLGYLMETLFNGGALDAFYLPSHMKKNRPGVYIQILCGRDKFHDMVKILFSESTTIGLRYREVSRIKLKRRKISVMTDLGKIDVKQIVDIEGNIRIAPEYDICRKIAMEKGLPLKAVYEMITRSQKKDDSLEAVSK